MGLTVNSFPLRGSLVNILEGIGDIRNTNGEVVYGINGNNHPDYGFCYYSPVLALTTTP